MARPRAGRMAWRAETVERKDGEATDPMLQSSNAAALLPPNDAASLSPNASDQPGDGSHTGAGIGRLWGSGDTASPVSADGRCQYTRADADLMPIGRIGPVIELGRGGKLAQL